MVSLRQRQHHDPISGNTHDLTFELKLHISLYVFRQAVRLSYNDWPFELKAPAEYKLRNYCKSKEPIDKGIELSSSVADEVSRGRTMPQLPPVDPSVPSCSNRKESSIVNVL